MVALLIAAAACTSSPTPDQPQPAAGTTSPTATSPAASAPPGVPSARVAVTLTVPPGEGGGALATPHTLTVPPGWTARVWARVSDARMEAWTPQGDLLVSQPDNGTVAELAPRPGGTATASTLLSGLTSPQGLAFARLGGHWVLYVGESDQIDRYPWGAHGISGGPTVIAARLPDLDPSGDDVHREKDIAVAPDGTLYFDVGSSSNASPGDRTATPQRAVIMAVNPDGAGACRRGSPP
jgi:glucose/arabinose dehydrogenase